MQTINMYVSFADPALNSLFEHHLRMTFINQGTNNIFIKMGTNICTYQINTVWDAFINYCFDIHDSSTNIKSVKWAMM